MTGILLIRELSKSVILSVRQGDHSPGLKLSPPQRSYDCFLLVEASL